MALYEGEARGYGGQRTPESARESGPMAKPASLAERRVSQELETYVYPTIDARLVRLVSLAQGEPDPVSRTRALNAIRERLVEPYAQTEDPTVFQGALELSYMLGDKQYTATILKGIELSEAAEAAVQQAWRTPGQQPSRDRQDDVGNPVSPEADALYKQARTSGLGRQRSPRI